MKQRNPAEALIKLNSSVTWDITYRKFLWTFGGHANGHFAMIHQEGAYHQKYLLIREDAVTPLVKISAVLCAPGQCHQC